MTGEAKTPTNTMSGNLLRKVVIVGSDAAAWMAASALARATSGHCAVQVIAAEPHGLAALGTGEGTLPALRAFHRLLGIDEDDLVRATGAGFKLGTLFRDWSRPGRDYFHPFGVFGAPLESVAFHHHWMRLRAHGHDVPLDAYALGSMAAKAGRFTRPLDDPRSALSTFSYGLHLDSRRYADFLRRLAEQQGVAVASGAIAAVTREGDTIKSITLSDGRRFEADLYIDCTGLLAAPDAGFEDWSGWLPCDRMLAVAGTGQPFPYTEIRAASAGWHWTMPLQGAVIRGLCYASKHMTEDAARAALAARYGGALPAEPRLLSFTNGRRARFWTGNVVALSDAAGILEPLEATNLHLAQSGIVRLLSLLPYRDRIGIERDEYNRLTGEDWDRARDFVILHYKATQRSDTPFWVERRDNAVPDALAYKIRLFGARGHVVLYDEEAFAEPDFLSVFIGQDILPKRYDPVADAIAPDLVKRQFDGMRAAIQRTVEAMPAYPAFLARYGAEQSSAMHP